MSEVEIYEGEIVEEPGWYEAVVSAYVQADEKVADGKWERARVAHWLVGRSYDTNESGLVARFAADVRRSASHLYHEAFAVHLRFALEGLGQPIPLTLTPTFYVEAGKGRRREIERLDRDAVLEAGELLAQAEDEHWTVSTLRENNHRALGTGENEWYTPPDVLADVRSLLGEIDLDPASSHAAQKHVRARRYFTREDNPLSREWEGRVFLNPPYSQPAIEQFVTKLVSEYQAGRVREAVLLTHNYTDTRWFHVAESVAHAICFTRGRIKFVSPDGELAAPTQGQAFFYYGERGEAFRDAFSGRGFIR